MAILIFFAIHWYSSLFFQSFFHHRYAAHKHFTMSRGWEKFFFICCFITQGSSYISAYAYGMMHRLHHVHTDTEEDPHSPANHPNFWRMMLETRNSYFSIYCGKTLVDEKIKKDIPRWDAFDRFAHNWITRVSWMMIYTAIYIWLATAWWQFLLLPFTIIMGTLQGAVVNWWAHKFGYRNFETEDTSRNIIPLDIFFWGESYHNNHHKFPGRPNNSVKWYEFDSIYAVELLLHKMKVIEICSAKNKKAVIAPAA
ncbi:MAG TPA: acyl-CoA desaturase [Chitinophagaceae bacterium]|nr:acyl-CoA desaturase [Chitinophagaceae bacterium]